MSRADEHFRLRLPSDVKERVKRAADANRRSMTAEIIVLLERALPAETVSAGAASTAPAE